MKAKVQIRGLQSSLALFKTDTGRFPTTSEGLEMLVSGSSIPGSKDSYIEGNKVPKDPWGNEYVYLSPGGHDDYDLESFGKDGQDGGTGNDADIENWNLEQD